MTMALPLAFAACTSDEFESFNNQGEALKNRKDLGQVALTVGGDAQTRWTGSMGAEVGDRIGAVLIDNKTADGSEDPMDDYTVSGTEIFTNYMYQNDGTAWRTNANLVEGNYYFYAPYVEYQGRGLLKFATPLVQTIDVDADGNIEPNSGIANYAEAAESPMVIGYKFLASTDDNTDVTISMKHLFAYPEFKFTNNSGEAVTLSRVLIENTATNEANKFVAGGGLNNEAIGGKSGKLFITGEQDAIEEAKDAYEAWNKKGDAPEFASWGAWQQVFAYDEGGQTIPTGLDKDLNAQSIEDLKTADLVANPTYSELIRVDFSDDVVVADGETISFRVIMPAGTYSTDKLTLYYVVPSGKAYAVKMKDVTTEKEITTLLQDRYTRQDYTNKGQLKTGAKQFESEIDENATLENAPSVVTTTEALIDLLMAEKSNTEALNVTLAGSDIEFNQDVLDAIAGMKSQSIEFSGLINIVGKKNMNNPMVINESIVFDKVVVKEGYASLNNNGISYGDVTIEKGAKLKVQKINAKKDDNGNLVAEYGNIVNRGTLVVGNAVIPSVTNYANIDIDGSGKIAELAIGGTTEAEQRAQVITVNKEGKLVYGDGAMYTVVNYGELTLNGGATIKGNITNNGKIVLASTATVTNEATLTNNVGGTIGEQSNAGKIVNKGELTNGGYIYAAIENQQPTDAEDIKNKVKYTVKALGGSRFYAGITGKGDGTHKELSVLDIEEGAILSSVDTDNLTVEFTVDELNKDTEMPLLVGAEGDFINTLNVTSIDANDSKGNGLDLSKVEGTSKLTTINVNGNISIPRGMELTLPATATEVNIKKDSELTNGTMTWANECEGATINIAAGATFSVISATITGVPTVTFVSEEKANTTRGQLDTTLGGVIENCTNNGSETWWKGDGPETIIVEEGSEISYKGQYIVDGFSAKEGMTFAEGLTGEVKLVTTGDDEVQVRIFKEQNENVKNATIVIGKNVRLMLGKGDNTETYWQSTTPGVDDIPAWIKAEDGAKLTITSATSKKFVYSDGSWSMEK